MIYLWDLARVIGAFDSGDYTSLTCQVDICIGQMCLSCLPVRQFVRGDSQRTCAPSPSCVGAAHEVMLHVLSTMQGIEKKNETMNATRKRLAVPASQARAPVLEYRSECECIDLGLSETSAGSLSGYNALISLCHCLFPYRPSMPGPTFPVLYPDVPHFLTLQKMIPIPLAVARSGLELLLTNFWVGKGESGLALSVCHGGPLYVKLKLMRKERRRSIPPYAHSS